MILTKTLTKGNNEYIFINVGKGGERLMKKNKKNMCSCCGGECKCGKDCKCGCE